jgi:hypothetical protein
VELDTVTAAAGGERGAHDGAPALGIADLVDGLDTSRGLFVEDQLAHRSSIVRGSDRIARAPFESLCGGVGTRGCKRLAWLRGGDADGGEDA